MAEPTEPQTRGIVTRDRFLLHRRAWEAAIVLTDEYANCLTVPQWIAAMVGCIGGPDALDDERAGAMVALAAQVIGSRV
jgi:hypothetical protein